MAGTVHIYHVCVMLNQFILLPYLSIFHAYVSTTNGPYINSFQSQSCLLIACPVQMKFDRLVLYVLTTNILKASVHRHFSYSHWPLFTKLAELTDADKGTIWYSRVECPTGHTVGHFVDDFMGQCHSTSSSSSRMRVIYHNWSATKQRPHPQSVAEISCHSVLSGDRIRQCETSSQHCRTREWIHNILGAIQQTPGSLMILATKVQALGISVGMQCQSAVWSYVAKVAVLNTALLSA